MINYDYRDIRWHWSDPRPARKENMKVNEMFTGNFLAAADLKGKAHKLRIEALTQEELGDPKENKWVLKFAGKEKKLVLNKTNTNAIAEMHGDETDNWMGKTVILFPTKTEFGGKKVDCIRVKVPEPVVEMAAADEDIPF